jgi:3-methyladenine DNA glycosylase/8-oxoguanine DNA glycosylase
VRERFQEAREKALQDPKIQELRKASDKANRDLFEAMRLKMQEIDPGLAEIIKKNVDEEKRGPEGRGGGKQKGFQNLTEAEREQLMKAREKVKDDPAVKAARDKREAATTPAERQAAAEELHKAINDATLKADPSLAPVLKKLGNTPPPPPVEPPGPGDEMGPPSTP